MAHLCTQALVVDDDVGVREGIADALRLDGIDVVPARGAAEAIAALERGCRPNIILVDLLMPGVSGERLLSMLRQHPGARGVPIVAMSASPERLARIEGPDALLAKPFGLDALLETVERLCTASAAERTVLGIPLVDSEHQRQLALASAVAEALRGGDEEQRAARLLEDLIDCTREHFASEAALMRLHRYPDSARHLTEHARCVTELQRWRESPAAGVLAPPSMDGIIPVVDGATALRASIESHIATLDRDLSRYLVARGVG
jgi:hemerythrin-like metal-binding protein